MGQFIYSLKPEFSPNLLKTLSRNFTTVMLKLKLLPLLCKAWRNLGPVSLPTLSKTNLSYIHFASFKPVVHKFFSCASSSWIILKLFIGLSWTSHLIYLCLRFLFYKKEFDNCNIPRVTEKDK